MPVLSRFYGIVIMIHFREHSPPHFHVKYGTSKGLVVIESGETEGTLPPRAQRLVQEWRVAHLAELREAWAFARNNKIPREIPPLE